MSQTLSDSNKCFLVNSSEIEERLDPAFYKPEYYKILADESKWSRCKDISHSIHHPPEYQRTYSEYGLQLIRSQNVRPVGLNLEESPVYFSDEFLKDKKVVLPSLGDVLIVRSGVNAGDVCVIEEDIKNAIIGADNLLLKPNTKLNPKFIQVYFFTKLGRKLLDRYLTGATNKHISPYYLSKVHIPVPSDEIQESCISAFEKAYKNKLEKEQEATTILSGIDSYLLNELGITLPEKDTSIEARMFQTTFQELSGRRFDPKLFDTHSKNLFAAVENTQYPKEPLKNLITHSAAGDWGIDEEAEVKEDQYDTCLVIRATEFDNLYNLKLENDRVRHRKIKKDKLKQLDIQPYDLLIEKSGGSPDQPVGRISLLTEELFETNTLCYSNFIHKIRVDTSRVDPSYLFCFLKTIHNIKITEIMQSQTNGIRNLIMGEYFNQSIVLPKLDKQIEIGKEANRRRFEAQRLSLEANKVLEDARVEIEQMILAN